MSSFCYPKKLLLVVGLLPACTAGMKLKMDAAWESVDPMGHRRIHQERDSPRVHKTGVRLPEDKTRYSLPGSSSKIPVSR